MHLAYEFIRGCVILVVFLAGASWLSWHLLKRSGDPAVQLFRVLLSAVILVWLAYQAGIARSQMLAGNGMAMMLAVYAAVGGLAMAIIWVPVLTGAVGGLIGNLFDGGNQEVEPKPFYSIFNAKRSKGKYFEALAEVRHQLDKFPTDFEGQMLLAELQAENLNDLPGAGITIEKLCAQKDQTPQNITYALNRLADWHLGLTKDRDAAKQAFEKIIELLPNTEMASRAAQRIAHMADTGMLLAPHDRVRPDVKKGVQNLGLYRGANGRLRAPEVNQEKLADDYVAHLERHPLDTDAREKLAVIYAQHYHRLDLAAGQLEQLIAHPGCTPKQVVHWLNLKADLQVQAGAEETVVRETVGRIIELFPDLPPAQVAQRRLDNLKLELKGREKTSTVHIGTYEQNLGLKRRA
jgi:tetratricopeptide (TPR) repeat protein